MQWHILSTYLIGILTIIYFYFRYRFSYWKRRGVPHLPVSFLWGNLKGVGKSRHIKDAFHDIYHGLKDKALFAGAYFSVSPVVVANDLDMIRDILIKDFATFSTRPGYYNEKDEPISANLFTIHSEEWRKLRNTLSPTFTSGKMKFMYPTLLDISEKFLKFLNEESTKDKEFEMKEVFARYTTDVIGTCAFGIECNSLKDPNSEFRNHGRKTFAEPRHNRMMLEIMTQFPKLARMLGMKSFLDETSEFFGKVVKETVEYREKNNVRRNDMMDLLIQLKNNDSLAGEDKRTVDKLTIEQIEAQTFAFFAAGFETSATTMSYALYEIARNPLIQETARKEISTVLKKYDGELTYDAMMEMKYIGQIILETLRKYPPVAVLVRSASNDYRIANTTHIINKGQTVCIPAYNIHHDPALYPNPDEFDPERFSPEQEKKRHPMSFLGFGEGPRNCIGLRFAKMQTHVGIIVLVKNFNIKLSPKTPVPIIFENNQFILTAKGGLFFELNKI